MATVDARTTRTLAEVFGSLSPETDDSQTLMASSTDGRAAKASASLENGVRVSTDYDEGLNCDIACDGGVPVVTRQGVETESSVQTSIRGQTRAVSGGREESVRGLDSISRVRKNQDSGIENVADEGNPTPLVGDGPDRKVEFSGNGILLVVEVHGSLGSEKKCGYEDNKGYSAENGGVPGEEFTDAKVGKKGELTKDKRGKHKLNANGEEKGDGEDVGEGSGEEDDDDGEDLSDQKCKYSVGDFVWGKIRSHPWWPGQIYDSSDASEYAAKLSKKDRLLVAYFGDGSFSWCPPSQLKPFTENFEEMSRQSNSKTFVNAVEKALDQIGRLVELEMTCSCISEEGQVRLIRPLVVNSGIKAGVLVSEGATGELSSLWRQPAELLTSVRYIAQRVSISSMLEVRVLKSFLSAFYCAKGGFSLPIYHEPQDVEGLEDKNRSGLTRKVDFNGPLEIQIKGPFEDEWHSSQASPSFGQPSQKGPMVAKDKLYQRRKEKSVAELMAEDMDFEPKTKNWGIIKEGLQSGKSVSGKKKRKENGEGKNYDDIVLTSTSGRKKQVDVCGSPKSPDNKVWVEDEANESPASREWKRNRVSRVGNDDNVAKQETEKISVPRERKKSKYLSPPYTDLKSRVRNSSSKRELEIESEKIAKTTRIGERMTRAAGQVIGSPPILKCSGETFKEKQSTEFDSGRDGSSSPQTTKADQGDQKKVIGSLEINAKEVLSQVQSAALNPLYLREKRSLDLFAGFISTFRSSIYLNGSNYKMYHKRQRGSKRKSLHCEPRPLVKHTEQTIHSSPEPRSQQRKYEKNEIAKLDKPKTLGRAARASSTKTNDKKAGVEASPVSLVVTFPPGFPLPSKNDLIKIFSKFGDLNETETDIFGNSYCARVVFVRSSDAEEAFSISVKKSPFGAAHVNYRLRYSSAASKANDDGQKASSPPKTPNKTVSSQSRDNEGSGLCFIKQKLEMITSMLENSDGKISPEMKSNLESEMKGLLEKISTVAK